MRVRQRPGIGGRGQPSGRELHAAARAAARGVGHSVARARRRPARQRRGDQPLPAALPPPPAG
eukprot:1146415-Prymnesium_polylepis.1